jgi:hypothetical protein
MIYDEYMDKEVIPLCDMINSLPGLKTYESCCGHGKRSINIYFYVCSDITDKGLFILTRCIDRRYWKYGSDWKIELYVGDSLFEDKYLPIGYLLHSNIVGNEAYKQADNLIENIKYNLNHEGFMELYNLGKIL